MTTDACAQLARVRYRLIKARQLLGKKRPPQNGRLIELVVDVLLEVVNRASALLRLYSLAIHLID